MNIDKQSRAYSIPKIIELPSLEHPVETEFLIPEYCPDIIKILKCDMDTKIVSKRYLNNSVEIECSAEITVLFCGEDNKLSSVITRYNFSKTIDNKLIKEDNVSLDIFTNHLNCRQTAARRIEIKGSVKIDVKINSFEAKEIICEIDREDIELFKCEQDMTAKVSRTEKQIVIEDDLFLGSNKPDVNYVMRKRATPIINECKLIGEKAVVKGNLKIDILYCSVENIPVCFSETISFSQIIELDINNKECVLDCDAILNSFDIKPILSNDTNSGFMITAKLCIIIEAECDFKFAIIKDCYSTKHKTETVVDSASIIKRADLLNERLMIKKTFNVDDTEISSVIDMYCREKELSVQLKEGAVNYTGEILVSLLCINSQNAPTILDFKADYEYNKKIADDIKEINDKSYYKILNCAYTLINEKQIEIQIEILLTSKIFIKDEFEYIKDITILEDECILNDAISVYFCHCEEKIWDVAKRFSTSVNKLKEQNNITDDFITAGTVLVISGM